MLAGGPACRATPARTRLMPTGGEGVGWGSLPPPATEREILAGLRMGLVQ